ncbi:MAG: GNAT family N-acetyltransferase [Candidatus Omnitrophica bacterium]|nr:GNAT family N-acetyltransferase [Candidatus Omnitrophota bacterium]
MKLRSIQTDKDIGHISNLLVEAFGNKRSTRDRLQMRINSPFYHPEHTRLIEIDNQIVSFVMFVPQEIRIGFSVLNGGWLYFGCTKPEYRGKGFYPIIFRNLLYSLQQDGYRLAMGYGRVKAYSRFGFVPCFYRSMISIPTQKVKIEKQPYLIRRCQEKDIDAVRELYDFYVPRRASCSLTRPKESWKTAIQYHHHREGLLVVEDNKTHQILGYLWIKPAHNDMLWVEEVESANKEASQTILAYCAKEAKRLNLRKIYFLIPLNHPFGQFCLELGAEGTRSPAKAEGNRFGWEDLVGLLNPFSALKVMEPEFENLISNSNHRDYTGKIPLEIDQERIDLSIEKGKIRFIQANQNQNNTIKIPRTILGQLITGFKDVNEIKHHPRVSIKPQFLEILSIIFPKRYPQALTWEWEFPEGKDSKDSRILAIIKKYFPPKVRKLLKFLKKDENL